jgi:nicotinate dehydrogenase subunit B
MTASDADAPALPGSLKANPVLADWIRVRPDGRVEAFPGKVEIGQGILTALHQIVADELDVGLERVTLVPARTGQSPNEGVTSGSLSVQDSGTALAFACAEIRSLFLGAAALRLGTSPDRLEVEDGVIRGPGNAQTSYWELADAVPLDRQATAQVAPKPAAQRRFVGRDIPRTDIPGKVFATHAFIHDLVQPNMLHGRVLRSEFAHARVDAVDDSAVRSVPGFVAIVRDGNFLGVLAESERAAEACVAKLAAATGWTVTETLPDETDLVAWLKSQPVETKVVDRRESRTREEVARTIECDYSRPYLAHGSIAPSCAVARWDGDGVRVWTHSQGIYNLRAEIAKVTGVPEARITVEHSEGAGCYGHNAADDAALDAVLLARQAEGRPVRVQWSRRDELTGGPLGAAMAVRIEAGLSASGDIVTWRHELWSNGHGSRPGRGERPTLRAASEVTGGPEPFVSVNSPMARGGGAERNAVPLYDFPAWEVVNNRLLTMPIRVSSLRTLGAFANVFAIESFVDEIAAARGECPLAFRLRHLKDARARAVLEAAANRAGWTEWAGGEGRGHGIAMARYKNMGAYCAAVAEVEADEEVRVRRLVMAVDVGDVINPDGVRNQIEGGAVQATSWVLKEAVRFDREKITSGDWETYPILRFSEVPEVVVEIVARETEKPAGAGEAAHGPAAGAIANAVHDALGVRVRHLPITRDNIMKAIEQNL